MRKTRSKGRRARRVTRRKGAGRCFGRWCGSTTPKNNGNNMNKATRAALNANASARAARNSHYAGLYSAYTGLPGMRANSVMGVHAKYAEEQAKITEQRKQAVLHKEQEEIDRLKGELTALKRGRPREVSVERKKDEITAAEARKAGIEGMTRNQLLGYSPR